MTFSLVDKIFDFHKHACCICGADIFDDKGFCEHCIQKIPFNNGKTCKYCGAVVLGDNDCCSTCRADKTFFDKAISSFDYVGHMQSLIKNFKYANKRYLAEIFANYMAATLMASGLQVDCVVAVPLSEKSLAKRGYNQSLLLAQKVCKLTNLPLIENNLIKIKDTDQQEKLSFKQRRENLLDAFKVTDKTAFVGKNVLIIDDVKTTGTTLSRIAKVLKLSKANKVYGLTAVSVKENIRNQASDKLKGKKHIKQKTIRTVTRRQIDE